MQKTDFQEMVYTDGFLCSYSCFKLHHNNILNPNDAVTTTTTNLPSQYYFISSAVHQKQSSHSSTRLILENVLTQTAASKIVLGMSTCHSLGNKQKYKIFCFTR